MMYTHTEIHMYVYKGAAAASFVYGPIYGLLLTDRSALLIRALYCGNDSLALFEEKNGKEIHLCGACIRSSTATAGCWQTYQRS